MSYVFTDDDYNKIYGVESQLGFMASLLSTAKTVQCDSGELETTLYALKEPLSKVLETLNERSEIARQSDGMKNHEWAQIINLVSGRASMTVRDIVALDEKLSKCVECDPDTEVIFHVWRAVITNEGKNRMMSTDNNMGGFHVQFDRPTPPELPPVTEQMILEMHGAKNARDLVKKLVAIANGTYTTATLG